MVLLQKGAERTNRHPVLLIAAADSSEGLPPAIRRCFSHEVSMGPLTEEQRVEMLSQSLQRVSELLPNVSEFMLSVFLLYIKFHIIWSSICVFKYDIQRLPPDVNLFNKINK